MISRPLSQLKISDLQRLLQSLQNYGDESREGRYQINRLATALGIPALGVKADQAIGQIKTKVECEQNYYDFVQTAFTIIEPGTPFIGNWHIECVCNHLDAMLLGIFKNLIINIPPGCMKLCADDTPILTPSGWKTHGDLKVGDFVFGRNGKPTKILKTSAKGKADMLCTFTNGEQIRVNGDHLWDVYDRRSRLNRVMKTSDIAETRMFSGDRSSFMLPSAEPMAFPVVKHTLHPYFIGCWLGDGTASKPDITSGFDDPDGLMTAIEQRTGLKPTKRYDHPTHTSTRHAFTKQGVKEELRELDLIDNKRIPKQYLFADLESRLQLLAGLVDTDGWRTKDGKLCIGTSIPALRDDIMTLLNTLQFRPCLIEVESSPIGGYEGGKPHWRIQFVPTMAVPCHIKRKKTGVIKQRRVGFKSIERIDDGKVGHCITVESSDGLYVVGEKCIVTHNSFLTSVLFPAWVWIHDPTQCFMYASYDQKLSTRDSIRCRALIESDWYRGNWGSRFRLTSDQNEKCLARGTHLNMANGRSKRIEKCKPGELIWSMENGKIVQDRIKHVWCNGRKPTRVLTLSDGTVIKATHNHRFYGYDDWRYVSDMKVGDAVAVARRIPAGKRSDLSHDDVFLLALWIAEGGKSQSVFSVTNTDRLVRQKVEAICRRRGWKTRDYDGATFGISKGKKKAGDTPMNFLKKYGLRSCRVNTVRIPDAIMKSTPTKIMAFFGAYLACDGHAATRSNKGYSWFSASERLIRDMGWLLKRLDIKCRIYRKKTSGNYFSWCLTVHSKEDIKKLASMNVFEKDVLHEQLQAWTNRKTRHEGGRSATIPAEFKNGYERVYEFKGWASLKAVKRFAERHGHDDLLTHIDGDLSWRRIIAIDEAEAETWHIETERTGTFFAEGVFSHNTKFMNNKGGWRIATSTKGRGMGEHPHWLMVDDPNNTAKAHSEADRKYVTEQWWDSAMSSRGRMLRGHHRGITQQRVHPGDLTGHVLAKFGGDTLHLLEPGEWQHLRLPMRYETELHCVTPIFEDPRKGHEGALLWPEGFSEVLVDAISISMGPITAAGQLQQRPTVAGGTLFRGESLTVIDGLPEEWLLPIFGGSAKSGISHVELSADQA